MTSSLTVNGMTCGSCVAHINRALRDLDGVKKVEVLLREGRVLVEHETTVDALVETIREAGYDVAP
jgi:copper chaperone